MRKSNVKIKGKLRTYLYLPLLLTMLLIIINVFVYMEDTSSGVLFSGFVLLYFVIMLIAYLRNKPLLIDELINFATQYGLVQKQLLNEFEIPYALVDYNAKFLWVNEQFTEVTGKDKKYHKSVMTVFPTLTKELLQRSEPVESINLTYNDRYYRVALKRIYFDAMTHDSTIVSLDESNEYLTAMYLFDETELNRYIRENEEQRLVAGLVYIDNYDEALDSIEDVKRSLLVALIDRKVNKYFTEIDALVRKIENDKYFVVFKNQYLGKLREDRFSIIEDVKTVKVGNEMAVTLSIGIGVGGDSYTKNYEYARMAIDLALGRGGDQVVVRDNEDVTYYGGKTNKQVERNNRNRVMRMLERIHDGDDAVPAKQARFDGLRLGVSWPRDVLAKRIDERIDMRLEQGMIEEVQRLMDEGASTEFLLGLGLEYRFITQYLIGEIPDRDDMLAQLAHAIKKFAKRQMTWFRRNPNIVWLDMQGDAYAQACEAVEAFLKK